MDETRYDLTAHQHQPADPFPGDHRPADHRQAGGTRRGLVALTLVIGVIALVGGAVVGASIGGGDPGSASEEIAAGPGTTTPSTTEDLVDGDGSTSQTSPQDPGPDPTEDTPPSTAPDDPDDGEGEGEGGGKIIEIPPGLFVPQLTFDEVINMGSASSAQWTLSNNGVGDVHWHLDTAPGFSFSSPDANQNWIFGPSGLLAPGESITITIGLTSPLPGHWSETMTLKHGSLEDEVTIHGTQPLQVVPSP